MRRVVVSGIGLVTPLACGRERSWARLLAADVGVRRIRGCVADDLPVRIAAEVPRTLGAEEVDDDGALESGHRFDAAQVLQLSTAEANKTPAFVQFSLKAADEALEDAGWPPPRARAAADDDDDDDDDDLFSPRNRTGVSIGVGMSSLPDIVNSAAQIDASPGGYRRVSPHFVPRILPNLAAGHVAIRHRLGGPNLCASTACAAGAHAIGDAFRAVRCGDADAMLAGGTESCVNRVAVVGFLRARALATHFNDDPARASRPFDARREGFVIGEGAAMLLLEERSQALAREARIYAEVCGYGTSGDAYHITAPSPDGGGARRAMLAALKEAELRPELVDYVNAHATSTPLGDRIEGHAIERVVGRRALVSSTKGAVGHLLGAAGAVEAAFCALALRDGAVPPTCNLEHVEADMAPLQYVRAAGRPAGERVDLRAAMSNSFGFGGTNASLIFRRAER